MIVIHDSFNINLEMFDREIDEWLKKHREFELEIEEEENHSIKTLSWWYSA